MSAGHTRITRHPGVVLTRTGDEALLVDEQHGQVHVVNSSAARLWDLCEGDPTLGELVASMAAAYGLDTSAVQSDVEATVGTFSDLGLLELTP